MSDVKTISAVQDKNEITFGIQGNAEAKNGAEITLANPVLINLTKAFGAGNEPDKATMDTIVEMNGGYFTAVDMTQNIDLYNKLHENLRVRFETLTGMTSVSDVMKAIGSYAKTELRDLERAKIMTTYNSVTYLFDVTKTTDKIILGTAVASNGTLYSLKYNSDSDYAVYSFTGTAVT